MELQPEIDVTTEGLTLQSHELLPGTAEFDAVLSKLKLPDMATCIAISVLKPWKVDLNAYIANESKMTNKTPLLLFYKPLSTVDIHDVIQYGFPSVDNEMWIEGQLSFEGGAVVLSDSCSCGGSSASSFLVCDFLVGDKVLECDEANILAVDTNALEKAACDVAHSKSRGIWAVYARDRVIPRYILRLVPRSAPVNVGAALYAIMKSPMDSQSIRVVAGSSVGLMQAIGRAPSGSTLVLEGVFRETISINNKSLRFVGCGDGLKSVIHAPADQDALSRPTAVIRLSGAHKFVFEGITAQANKRRDHSSSPKNSEDWANANPDVKAYKKPKGKKKVVALAPLIDQGRCANGLEVTEGVEHALFKDCVFMGGCEVSAGSTAHFKDCTLVDGVVNGLYVASSNVLMEDCVVARHDSANVAVELSSTAYFLRTKIFGSRSTGVYLFNKGCAVFEGCDIFANEQTGIQIEGEGTDPIIRGNRIHHGEQYGVFVTNQATGTFECNVFYANLWAAIATTEGGNPLFRFNSVFRGFHYGLYSFDNGRGLFMNNFVHHNKDAGLAVASGAAPELQQNEFYGSASYGCYFFLKGAGKLEKNKICSNQSANVCITYSSDPIVIKNRIYSGETDGVMVMQEGKGQIEENEIFGNYESNVMVQFGADPMIRSNKIYSGKKAGVVFLHKAKGSLIGNEIFSSEYSGVAVKTESHPIVKENHIHDNKRFAVLVQMKGKGEITDNSFGSNGMGSVRVWCDSTPLLARNQFDPKEKAETRIDTSESGAEPPREALAPKRPVPLPPQVAEKSVEKSAEKRVEKKQTAHKRVPVPSVSDAIPGEDYEHATDL